MSHLLQTPNVMQGKQILSIPCKQIVAPKYRKLLHQTHSSLKYQAKIQLNKQEVILRNLCQKLTEKQLEKLQIQNDINMRRKFQKLKQKLRQSVIGQNKQSQVIKHFEGKDKQQSLSSVIRLHIQNIQLGMKYQNKIASKLIAIKEISEIEDNKEKYRNWLNTTSNSPLKSPNYNKMNYVMEKISKKGELNSIFGSNGHYETLRHNIERVSKEQSMHRGKQNILALKYARKSDCVTMNPTISSKIQHGQYSPKSRINKFRVKQL